MAGSSAAFSMTGARAVLELHAGAVHFEQQVSALERAVDEQPNLAFDLAKTLIESCCKTVMTDRGCAPSERADLGRLLKDTLALLRLTPDEHVHGSEIAASLRLTAGGLQTAIQGIAEIRNIEGFASHGKDAYTLPLEAVQAEMVARAADAIVCFLFRVHKDYPSNNPGRRIRYGDNPDFNAYLDEAYAVQIGELTYPASEALFRLDADAYRDLLASFLQDVASLAAEGEAEGTAA